MLSVATYFGAAAMVVQGSSEARPRVVRGSSEGRPRIVQGSSEDHEKKFFSAASKGDIKNIAELKQCRILLGFAKFFQLPAFRKESGADRASLDTRSSGWAEQLSYDP